MFVLCPVGFVYVYASIQYKRNNSVKYDTALRLFFPLLSCSRALCIYESSNDQYSIHQPSVKMDQLIETTNKKIWEEGKFQDVSFSFPESENPTILKANKVILAEVSPVFEVMFFVGFSGVYQKNEIQSRSLMLSQTFLKHY